MTINQSAAAPVPLPDHQYNVELLNVAEDTAQAEKDIAQALEILAEHQ